MPSAPHLLQVEWAMWGWGPLAPADNFDAKWKTLRCLGQMYPHIRALSMRVWMDDGSVVQIRPRG